MPDDRKPVTDIGSTRFLAGIPPDEHRWIFPHLKRETLVHGQRLYQTGQPMRVVYFPRSCVISVLATVENGRSVEVSQVGPDGMLGIALALGDTVSKHG